MPTRQAPQGRMGPKVCRIALFAVRLIIVLAVGGPLLINAGRKSNANREAKQLGGQAAVRRLDSPDNVWRDIDERLVRRMDGERQASPKSYRTLSLNRSDLFEILSKAPLEFTETAKTREVRLSLPLPDGTFQRFRIEASPIMEPALGRRYPEIKTYKGQGLDDPNAVTRFDWTPSGFHGLVLAEKGSVLIEPYAMGDTANYIVYFLKDAPIGSFECNADDSEAALPLKKEGPRPELPSGTTLRSYRLAVAATGEYTQRYGNGTVSGGLAAVATTINLVDSIYERELAIRLVLVANNDAIIFTDPVTDGYTSDNTPALINENQTKIDSVIGSANYDIGHVFDGRSEQPGFFSFQGQAGLGVACVNGVKARGVSITRSVPPVSAIAFYNTAHEMGHQFGATHTFNANTGQCLTQRTASTAYEPGTGSTIMGYRFTCGSEDLMSGDTYFHNASLEQIVNFTNGSTCPTQTATGNQPPTVDAGANYTIPKSTPFILTAKGQDPDGDPITYCWEEFDLGPAAPPDTDDGSRPIFRSFQDTPISSRSFPRLLDILSGTPRFGESLPTTTRTMNFRVTVRDNRSIGGGLGSAAMQVNVRSESGPFTVDQPAASVMWPGGSTQTVTWSVANTSEAPVSCTSVRILLSTDDGVTFPIVLANNTPNDGSETVTIPSTPTVIGRVKVEAVGNIFFNMSQDFTITGLPNTMPAISGFSPTSGTAGTSVTITGTNLIDPASVRFNQTPALFTVNSTLEIIATVPAGATPAPISVTTAYGTATSVNDFNFIQAPNFFQFSSPSYSVNENGTNATITVNRTGDTSVASTVDYASSDDSAQQRTDYIVSAGKLKFVAGETSKAFTVLIVDDLYMEANEQLNLRLSNPVGGTIVAPDTATLTIVDNDNTPPVSNPLDTTSFFIRQHYHDFLSREPDPGGLGFWIGEIDGACTPVDIVCLNHRRRDVSDAFFFEPEFQQTGGYVFRLYRAAYGNNQPSPNPDPEDPVEARRLPSYASFIADRAKVIAGPGLAESQLALANQLVRRPEFIARFPTLLDGFAFVDRVIAQITDDGGARILAGQSNALYNAYNSGGRGLVLYRIADDSAQNPINNRAFIDAEYRRTFVYTEYAGYLRRDADIGGFLFWLNQVNQFPLRDTVIQHTMACAFITSSEYQQRFSSVVTRSNQECGQ